MKRLASRSFREGIEQAVTRLGRNVRMDYVLSQETFAAEPRFLQRAGRGMVVDVTSRVNSINRRGFQGNLHHGGYGLRHEAFSPIRSGKHVPEIGAVPFWTHLYHSKQLRVLFSCDDICACNRVIPSILAELDELLCRLDGSVRHPLQVASYFTVLRVCLEYAFRIGRDRVAQMEPRRVDGIWKHGGCAAA